MKAYVDTNILVDLILSRKQFLENAQRVFALDIQATLRW